MFEEKREAFADLDPKWDNFNHMTVNVILNSKKCYIKLLKLNHCFQAEQGRCDQMISEIHDKLRECKDLAESINTNTPEHSQLISVIGMLEKLLASTQAHRNNVVDSVNKTQLVRVFLIYT